MESKTAARRSLTITAWGDQPSYFPGMDWRFFAVVSGESGHSFLIRAAANWLLLKCFAAADTAAAGASASRASSSFTCKPTCDIT